jgi:tetratricopeptide (TPR) repeat protein
VAPSALDLRGPLPSRFGSFDVEEKIAAGGMGTVYRARSRSSGDEVALKVMAVADRHRQLAFRAEIKSLALLRHPGIVRIVDHGADADQGLAWYAMDLIHGSTLADVCRQLWDASSQDVVPTVVGPEGGAARALAVAPGARQRTATAIAGGGDLGRVIRLVADLCRPLAHLHGRGIVHRDLKPANAVVQRDDGRVVIIDFGLACESPNARGRERLETTGPFQGTVLYVAPEQCRDARVDARADLYSLGCILYELVTGTPPFVGGSGREILDHHLRSAPIPASQVVVGLPDELDALIARLLAKNPRDRIGYADEVEHILRRIAGDQPRAAPAAPEAAAPLPCLYAPGFVGREEPLGHLDRQVDRLLGGAGGCVVMTGETGIGKTFFLAEMARRARNRGVRVVTGTAAPPLAAGGANQETDRSDPTPLALFRPVLQVFLDLVRAGIEPAAREIAAAHAHVLAAIEPAFAPFGARPAEAEVSPEAARTHVIAAVRAVIAATSSAGPTMLILDDLQWADDLSMRVVRSMQEESTGDPALLLVASLRTDEASVRGPIQNILERAEALPLERLDSDQIQLVVSDMLGLPAVPESVADLFVGASGGNPYFASEYLRAAVADRLLERHDCEWRLSRKGRQELDAARSRPTPPSLREIADRRVRGLSAPARALLQVAAAFGRECELELLLQAAGLEEPAAIELLVELEARAIVAHFPDGTLRIAHESLRTSAHQAMSPAAIAAAHRSVAGALRDHGEERHLFVLGQQFLLAGNRQQAFAYFSTAGRKALEAGFLGEARGQLERASALLEADPTLLGERRERAAIWRRYGEALAGLGHMEDAERALRAALRHLGIKVPTTPGGWAALLAREGALQALLRLGGGAIRPASDEERADWKEAAVANTWLGFRHMFTTNSIAMVGALAGAANQAERAGALALSVVPLTFLGRIVGLIGLESAAAKYFQLARVRSRASGDITTILRCDQSEGFYLYNSGRLDSAAEVVLAAIAMSRGVEYERCALELVLAFIEIARGRFRDAEALAQAVATASARHGNAFYENQGRKLLAICALQTGRLDEASRTAGPLAEEAASRGNELERLNLAAVACAADYRAGREQPALARAIELAQAAANGSQLFHLFELHTFVPEVLVGSWARRRAEGHHDEQLGRIAWRACELARKCAHVFKILAPTALRLTARARALRDMPRAARRALRGARALSLRYGMPLDLALTSLEMVRSGQREITDPLDTVRQAQRLLGEIGCSWHFAAAHHLHRELEEYRG